MFNRHTLLAAILLVTSACSEKTTELHLQLGSTSGLSPGNLVILNGQTVGSVTAVKTDPAGDELAELTIRPEYKNSFTNLTRFTLVQDSRNSNNGWLVEVTTGTGTGTHLAEGTRVEAEKKLLPNLPLGEILKNLTQGLGMLSNQIQQFRVQMQKLPNSPEAKQLQQEWLKLQNEMEQAQKVTEESVKKQIIPKLQEQLKNLDQRFRQLEKQPQQQQQ